MDASELTRTPLLEASGAAMLRRLREHPDAPRWNYAVGDRLVASDLPRLDAFRTLLAREPESPYGPGAVATTLEAMHARVPYLRRSVAEGTRFESSWERLPTTCRKDLATEPWVFVPDDADLERLLIYRTAGTTGHPIEVPHHPWSIACYQPLVEHALARYGVELSVGHDLVACFLISSQIKTYTYSTVLYGWQGAGFAKVNLRGSEWPAAQSAGRYFDAMKPGLVTGEPVALAELVRLGIPAHPMAVISTSVGMPEPLARRLRDALGCPIIDWYSMVETGPIAYQCRHGNGFHVLSPDLFVESLRTDGTRADEGERGELTVSGGRNPYLPLLRYRTGDFGAIVASPCPCGDPMPRIVGLEGRTPMLFRAADGTPVGPVDLSRLLREFPLLLHTFDQRDDLCCSLVARAREDRPAPTEETLKAALRGLLGELPLDVRIDPTLGEDWPVVPYRSALRLEL